METEKDKILEDNIVFEEQESSEETEELDQAKLERIEKEKKELLNRAVSGNIHSLRDRVAYILNNSLDARNSDIDLAWSFWTAFERDKFVGDSITKDEMKALTRINSLSRERAKIQNEYKLFEADYAVKKFRGVLQEDKKNQAVADKPSGIGVYSVYIDETGKTQEYLSVGSLWVLEGGGGMSYLNLSDWKKKNDIKYEFHFSEVNKRSLPYFKEFFTRFLSLHPAVSFKLIVVNNKGFADKNAAITDLTYHLLSKGVEHENATGRAPLPRVLQVWIDEEEAGSDKLKIENIKERINGQKIDGLYTGDFYAVSSEGNFYIQIIDLFTGAINRKLHNPDSTNVKDELADFILGTLDFDVSDVDKDNSQVDHSTVFNLKDPVLV
jgi:hypothetical protein